MKRINLGTGVLVGILLTAPLLAILYLGRQAAGLPFTPYDMFNWTARELPGDLVTFGIDLMIDTMLLLGISVVDSAKTAERLMAVLIFLVTGTLASVLFFAVMKLRSMKADLLSGLVFGALFGLPQIAISLAISQSNISAPVRFLWQALWFLAWGGAISLALARLQQPQPAALAAETTSAAPAADEPEVERLDRRRFLIRLGATTATITVAGTGLAAVLASAERRRQEQALLDSIAHQAEASTDSPFPNANDPIVPVPGTRPEYTPIKDHYKVFLQTEPTVIDGSTWLLPITGMVDNPLMLTIDDLRDNYEPRHQYVTLTCISGRVGTGLISTTQWTGASVQEVLADAGVRDEARYLIISSGDGFYETVDLDLINSDDRIMFCYAWDGNTLPVDHGYPLRIWIPDRYGMKQPKWITSIEVTDEYQDGYWVERNWDKEARVKTTSVVDTVVVETTAQEDSEPVVLVGGIAYAGARGISKVEVRVDGGPWQPAELRAPLSETTWVIWRYEWPFVSGDHNFEVRCAEGDGTPQIEERMGSRPGGATGIHSRIGRL